MPLPLDVSSPASEGQLQVSKSRMLPVLIDSNEMEDLFSHLGSVYLLDGSRPIAEEQFFIAKEAFLNAYRSYVDALKSGESPDEAALRPFFSAMLTLDPKLLYAMPLPNGKFLVKAKRPVIQLKRHHFIYTDRLYSGVMGEGSITWGIQFSYPQLFLDPKTQKALKVDKSESFPNSELFHKLAKWVRHHTVATPLLFEGERKNQVIRLGKQCFSWINNHPGLKKSQLEVGYG